MSINEIFFELIRVSLGTQDTLSRPPLREEWAALYAMSKKQSLVGICFAGLQKLYNKDNPEPSTHNPQPSTNNPQPDSTNNPEPITHHLPEVLYLRWLGTATKIQQRNHEMDIYTQKALDYFREKGYPCQVLKGQGIAKLYGELASFRQSGDVDIWLGCKREELYDFARKEYGQIEGLNYYHIHCPIIEDTEVEAHVWPSYMTNPFKNILLHQFCLEHQPKNGCSDNPDRVFDAVFIMLHCYRHFVGRGVGMRQVMDYYFVLKTLSVSPLNGENKTETMKWIKRLGMGRFATAMMWVMKEVFGIDEKYLICECNEEEGLFLLDEILNTGNMGHGETRFKRDDSTAIKRFIGNQRKNLHLLTHYPAEVCWSPFFNLVRYFWQLTIKKQ